MQKWPKFFMESSRKNRHLVKLFKRKLENLSISDYYGLKSPGLTCYLNSVLQVLFMTKDFREAVKRCCSEHLTPLDRHLQRLFCELERGTAETHIIAEQLGIKDVYEQRDAAEYFEKILCQISSEASKIFRGELNHKTMCQKCSKMTDSRSFFWVLPLSMDDSSSKSYSVQQGLEDFFKVQRVSEENQMFCDGCNKKQDTDIKYELTQSPDVLTLLLKRFTFDSRQSCYTKLHCRADMVPTLHLQSCSYELYAAVHHYGYLTGGHYTADIKSFETGSWYCFNDSTVKSAQQQYVELEQNSMRSMTAYLLMYRKVDEQTRQTAGRDLRTQRGHSAVPTEDRWDESELRDFLLSDRLKRASCRGGDYKLLNGDIISDYVIERKRADSLRREKKQRDTEAEGQQQGSQSNLKTSEGHFRTKSSRGTFVQNHKSVVKVVSNQSEAAAALTQENSSKLREKTSVRDVSSSVKTSDPPSSVSLTQCSCHRCALENSLKRNNMKKPPVAAENYKYQTSNISRKEENTESQSERRSVQRFYSKNTRTPWK